VSLRRARVTARFLSCIRAADRMGDPRPITAMHSARRRPGTLAFAGGRSNAFAVVATVVFVRWKLKIDTRPTLLPIDFGTHST
jgi:hypothetical protein